MNNDYQLLREYAESGSEPAFTQLVERHKNLVHASALRQTGDHGLAEEVTQAVFVVLARKAATLGPAVVLSGWLFRATRFAAADVLKRERRRRRREQEALAMNSDVPPPTQAQDEAAWQDIAPILDESLARLGESDRHALLLRFFERKNLAEVGRGLGLSEDAAGKRVHRALEKLRGLLGRRGVTVPGAVLAALLAANAATAAPTTLAVSVAAGAATLSPLAKATLTLMAWSKAKTATVVAGALLVAGGGTVATVSVVRHLQAARDRAAAVPESTARAVAPSAPGDIVFPPDAGVVDVTRPPYGAKGDGRTDDTAAIQQALEDYPNKQAIIYLPNGTYLVSAMIRWGQGAGTWALCKRTSLQGQSREGTILKLKDACPGFSDPAVPQPVIWTGPTPAERYRNAIRNLTVDTGRDNPGAIGVQFNSSYVGCVRDVLIRSGDGQGVTGLDMGFTEEIGPLLIKNLTVRGFDVGIHGKGGYSSQTFEHITLEDQNKVAFLNYAESVSIRDLTTSGRVPAFWNRDMVGLAVIIDAKLNGLEEAKLCAAITNRAGLFVRNLSVNGFAGTIVQNGPWGSTNVADPFVKEWASRPLPGSKPSLNLPVKETPEVPWDSPAEWANPVAFGADPTRKADSSDAIQQAIDSGRRTVYLPRGDYLIRNPLVLRGNVRRLIGCEASLYVDPSIPAAAALTVADGDSPVVVVERIAGEWVENKPHPWFLSNSSKRTVVVRDCLGMDAEFAGSGEVFLENVGGKFAFHGPKAWARQLCMTGSESSPPDRWWHLRNTGGVVWALGVRTGGPGPIVTTTRGGQTEVLGGMMYSSAGARVQPEPAFVVEDGALSVSINEVTFRKTIAYPVLVRRVAHGQPADLLMPEQAPGGIGASLIALFATE